jgi:hypothetical protein
MGMARLAEVRMELKRYSHLGFRAPESETPSQIQMGSRFHLFRGQGEEQFSKLLVPLPFYLSKVAERSFNPLRKSRSCSWIKLG